MVAEAHRSEMRMHFERAQARKEADLRLRDGLRESRRETVVQLGTKIRMLSTKPEVDENPMNEGLAEQQVRLSQLMRELETTQRRIILAH